MNRRTFLAGIAATSAVWAFAGPAFAAFSPVAYSPAKLKSLRDSGKTVLLDFYADWCSTCRAQERVVESLVGTGAYNGITIMRVDWDTYRSADIVKDMNIPRRSTLVLLKGETELGRVVAQTSEAAIKGLLDKAG